MKFLLRHFALLLLLPLLCLQAAWAGDGAVLPVPALKAPLTDQVGLLKPDEAEALNQKLLAFSQEKGSQIAVLIVATTAPEDIFSYAFRVADAWKLGRKGVDDGVLMTIAINDRTSNLQIGYGLEGTIPDARAKQVLDDIMAPHFRQGDFAAGINVGVDALITLIKGEALPLPSKTATNEKDLSGLMVLAAVIGLVAGMVLRAALGKTAGALGGGAVALVVALLLGTGLALAIAAAFFALLMASGKVGGAGGMGGGGFGGGSGGGYRGGGGGFGGGGASGRW